jgi:hypothetical protein
MHRGRIVAEHLNCAHDPEGVGGNPLAAIICSIVPAAPKRDDLPRMRIHRGRVMHRVERTGRGYRSLCRRKHPVKGVSSTVPRADGDADDWTTERHWYPDCQHCPSDTGSSAPSAPSR